MYMRPTVLSISVLITTKNRASDLRSCLNSLTQQTRQAKEIIVVDNGSTDSTKQVCYSFADKMPVVYIQESRVGIPFGRNAGINRASGTVCAFIDDDCEADAWWLERISKHFRTHPKSDAVIGLSRASNKSVAASEIEQVFYERWFCQNIENLFRVTKLKSGRIIDFKNCAVKTKIIKKTLFSTSVPFGDVGNNEDLEIGDRLFKTCREMWYDPNITVYHSNSGSMARALYRNYWEGYSNRLLLAGGLDVRDVPVNYPKYTWFFNTIQKKLQSTSPNAYIFSVGLVMYPLASRLGRLIASIRLLYGLNHSIPQRR